MDRWRRRKRGMMSEDEYTEKLVYLVMPPNEAPNEFEEGDQPTFDDFHKANDEAIHRTETTTMVSRSYLPTRY